jgi:hypothetical protein
MTPRAEHPIHQLANSEIQTAAPKSPIGWRVEFLSIEAQMTDFENTSFVVFIVLLSQAIMSMNLNFYIPISKVMHCTPLLVRHSLTRTTQMRTCVAHNSATRSTKPNSSSATKSSRPPRLAPRPARRLQTTTRHSRLLPRQPPSTTEL